jgi:hypothetical protein
MIYLGLFLNRGVRIIFLNDIDNFGSCFTITEFGQTGILFLYNRWFRLNFYGLSRWTLLLKWSSRTDLQTEITWESQIYDNEEVKLHHINVSSSPLQYLAVEKQNWSASAKLQQYENTSNSDDDDW